ncbi:MAG: diguanylate cyclase [Actinomycetota bacterium]
MAERPRILVSAPDRAMRDAVRGALPGFPVIEATDEITTSALGAACRPAVLVLDATDPDRAGLVTTAARDHFLSWPAATVFIVDRPPLGGKVAAAFGGADDYVVCPFADSDLAARVEVCLRRSAAVRSVNPLTGMPGNAAVGEELAGRLEKGDVFALLHIDLDDFKALNDSLGFARGDEVIVVAARCVVESLVAQTVSGCFAGHVGGDDFVVITPPEVGEKCAADIVGRFDAETTGCAMSVGVVGSRAGEPPLELAERAARAKAAAKAVAGSSWSVLS